MSAVDCATFIMGLLLHAGLGRSLRFDSYVAQQMQKIPLEPVGQAAAGSPVRKSPNGPTAAGRACEESLTGLGQRLLRESGWRLGCGERFCGRIPLRCRVANRWLH